MIEHVKLDQQDLAKLGAGKKRKIKRPCGHPGCRAVGVIPFKDGKWFCVPHMLEIQQYGKMGQVPRKVPEGRVLAHNHVRHHDRMSSGINGFRWWTWPKQQVPSDFVPCGCGYAGLPHVAGKGHAERYKCETRSQIRALDRLSDPQSMF